MNKFSFSSYIYENCCTKNTYSSIATLEPEQHYYASSSFATNNLFSNWFGLAHSPIFYPTKIFPCTVYRMIIYTLHIWRPIILAKYDVMHIGGHFSSTNGR